MNKIFNKLVRDNIPQIIENNNEKAKNTNEILEELADVYEVLVYIARIENKDICDIIKIADKKRAIKGGFTKKIFLKEIK